LARGLFNNAVPVQNCKPVGEYNNCIGSLTYCGLEASIQFVRLLSSQRLQCHTDSSGGDFRFPHFKGCRRFSRIVKDSNASAFGKRAAQQFEALGG
jgi:hypothetical protein